MKPTRPTGKQGMWNLYKMGGIAPAFTSMFDPRSAQHMAFIRSMMKEQRKESMYEIRLQEMEAVVFDLETTGFSPYHGDEIIAVGAVAVKGGVVLGEETFYSTVQCSRKIPEDVIRLTGITNEMAASSPDLLDVLSRFLAFVHRRVLIAHGSGHDKPFLRSALWKTSKTALTHRIVDTMMLGKWLHPGMPHYGLDILLEKYSILAENRHHALADSLMTAQLWAGMLALMAEKNVLTLGDLYAHLSQR
ncbi:exonuclease domain-containing protein [Paenibacillus sp. CC-CFT747]|nr:exonuclease domain-containing protein [Paenibacillus sp. CC-CFT747]